MVTFHQQPYIAYAIYNNVVPSLLPYNGAFQDFFLFRVKDCVRTQI